MKTSSHAINCKHSTTPLFLWTLAWLLSLALLAFGAERVWDYYLPVTLGVIAVNLLLGCQMIIANKHHLDQLDELQRKLHMNAMAVSLGVSVVFGAVYGLLEPLQLLNETPSPSNLLFVMALSYIASLLINTRKYQ